METARLEAAPMQFAAQGRRNRRVWPVPSLRPGTKEVLAPPFQPSERSQQHKGQQQRNQSSPWLMGQAKDAAFILLFGLLRTNCSSVTPLAAQSIGNMLWAVKPGRVLISLIQS